jgi:DNA replication protein DnaC
LVLLPTKISNTLIKSSVSQRKILSSSEHKRKSKKYKLDVAFHEDDTQAEVFDCLEPILKCAINGENVCIFAYGQTGTGKTYTTIGELNDN